MDIQNIMSELRKKYKVKVELHPTDTKAVVLYGIDDLDIAKICRKYGASGTYNEQTRIGVVCNFGQYFNGANPGIRNRI